MGNLYSGRGIEIIAALARKCPWAFFHLIGGNESDINYWRKSFEKIGNVKLHGFISPSQTDKYRRSLDVLLAPYQRRVCVFSGKGDTAKWMSPLKIFEYMASRRPMLVSDLPALREILKHEATALFCDPENVESRVNALKRLRDNPKLAARIGKTAYSEFKTKYTWKARAEKVIE